MSLNTPLQSLRPSATQSPRMKSSPRLSSSPRSSSQSSNHTGMNRHTKTSQQRQQQSPKALQNFPTAKSTPPVSPRRMTSTSPASFDSFKRSLQSQSGHELNTQPSTRPGTASSAPHVGRPYSKLAHARATVSEPGRPANKTSIAYAKSAPPDLPRRRPDSTAAWSLGNDSISGAKPPTSIWSSASDSRSVHTTDLRYPSFSMTSKRAERLGALARLSVEPLPKVLSALANNRVPAGAGSSSIGQHMLRSCSKRFLKARK